jgi:NADPH:quinone reductase-like Zn-dependent oxidoreductase
MPKVVRFHQTGAADVLQLEDLPTVDPKAGQVRIQVQAVGLNRAEVMFRTGQYLEEPKFPSRIGIEAAGVVDAVGPDVTNVRVGDKISVATGQSINEYGTYCESAIVPAASAIPYPSNLTPEEAASIWVQYLTAYFAFVDLARVQSGQFVLITAATGGPAQRGCGPCDRDWERGPHRTSQGNYRGQGSECDI